MSNIIDSFTSPAQGGCSLFRWPSGSETLPAHGVEVIGIPSDSGNSIASGARFGPTAIRHASQALRPGVAGFDHGDLSCVRTCDWPEVLTQAQSALATVVERRSLPVVLGGDHSISYAAVAALCGRGPLNVVWFDAHTDYCAWPGGGWHNHKQVLRRIAGLEHVSRILQIGHRGITYFDETRRFRKLTVVTAVQAMKLHAGEILEHLPPGEPVYLSIDIDAVDPRWAPGTGHPVPGGLSVARLVHLACEIASNRTIVGLDLTEVNPLLDHDGITATAAAGILAEILQAGATASAGLTREVLQYGS
jgi:agmatinase